MKLIRESAEEVEYITEASDGDKKNLYIKGIFLQSAIKNRNGRIYPESVMDNEVGRYIKETVDTKSAFGELDHPKTPAIGLDRVSHLITSLHKEGTNWVGKAKIMDTTKGRIAKGIIESGGRLGVSSRAIGTLKPNKDGINEVQADFRLSTAADLVSTPSAPDAFVNGIMEGVEYFYDATGNLIAQELAEIAKDEVETAVRSRVLNEAKKLEIFERFLKSLS